MINTLNENALHRQLKDLYALDDGDQKECNDGKYIYDIVKADNSIVEIQTKNVSHLAAKIAYVLTQGKKITVVHPVITCKYITLQDAAGNTLSKRKSPKKETVYSLFRELTGIYPFLLNSHFTLEVPFITIEELRLKTELPQQTKNNSRRFLKNWISTDKKLISIEKTCRFNSLKSYLSLLPANLKEIFTVQDLKQAWLEESTSLPNYNEIRLLLWVFQKMNIISFVEKKGKCNFYKLNKTSDLQS